MKEMLAENICEENRVVRVVAEELVDIAEHICARPCYPRTGASQRPPMIETEEARGGRIKIDGVDLFKTRQEAIG